MCSSSVTKTTNLLNIPVFCERFRIGVENLDPNQTRRFSEDFVTISYRREEFRGI